MIYNASNESAFMLRQLFAEVHAENNSFPGKYIISQNQSTQRLSEDEEMKPLSLQLINNCLLNKALVLWLNTGWFSVFLSGTSQTQDSCVALHKRIATVHRVCEAGE